MCPKIADVIRNGSATKKPNAISETDKAIAATVLTVYILCTLSSPILEIMRFIQNKNVWLKLGDLIANLL